MDKSSFAEGFGDLFGWKMLENVKRQTGGKCYDLILRENISRELVRTC